MAEVGSSREEGYRFALLHPVERTRDQRAENASLLGPRTLGIEVTVPELAARCLLGNIDPQHGGDGSGLAAIEASLNWEPLPPDGAWLVTIRPDLDALGGMALFVLRRSGTPLDAALPTRVAEVAQADAFAHGPWPGPRPLPRDAAECLATLENGALGPAAAAAADHQVPIADRVTIVARWLQAGQVPAQYNAAVEQRAAMLAAALASGALRVETAGEGRIAIVNGAAAGAVRLGYLLAPVVVALSPAFRFRGGPPHRKYTISQWAQGHVDLVSVTRELSRREPGWGGAATIIGSPQGNDSGLAVEEVVKLTAAALLT